MAYKVRTQSAFTLVESLAVISIIGILATIAFFGISSYEQTARDATRKSDLYAISQGFEARALDQTCNNQAAAGKYPSVATTPPDPKSAWLPVKNLVTNSDSACNGSFTATYLSLVPNDPQSGYAYYFTLDPTGSHYRLAASLEKNNTNSCAADLNESSRWVSTYNGVAYDCPTLNASIHAQFGNTARQYDYYIGK